MPHPDAESPPRECHVLSDTWACLGWTVALLGGTVAGAEAAEWKSPFDGPIVNVHHHLSAGSAVNPATVEAALDADLRFLAREQIVTALIFSAGGGDAGQRTGDMMRRLLQRHAGWLIGIGSIPLDAEDPVAGVRQAHALGCKGVKFHRSRDDYSAANYKPVFEFAAELGLVCAFHTNTSEHDLRVHPVHVDQLQRDVRGLKVIAYHLANPNFEVAGELMLKNPNLYFEMSGITSRMIEEHYLGAAAGREMLLNKYRDAFWHPQMWGQLMFATDGMLGVAETNRAGSAAPKDAPSNARTPWTGAQRVLRYKEMYRDWLQTLRVPEELQYRIMYDNAAKLFGLPPRKQ